MTSADGVAGRALGEIGVAEAIPLLLDRLQDEDAEVRQAATEAFERLKHLTYDLPKDRLPTSLPPAEEYPNIGKPALWAQKLNA